MPFVKSNEDLTRLLQKTWEIYGAEQLTVVFETKPEIIERLLPPPLKPASEPHAAIFIADYPRTSFGLPYLESCLSVKASYVE